ncbi:MAG: 6-carboxytetrahydropterin synthase [Elusimicrobiota bacterium]
MYSVTKKLTFCYGHRLLNYDGKCRHLHGHNGLLELVLAKPELDELGMVMDFVDIKSAVKKWIDDELDHKMILNEQDPLAAELKKHQQPCVLLPGNPTAEAIARHIFEHCRAVKLPVKRVRLWETPDSCAEYGTD